MKKLIDNNAIVVVGDFNTPFIAVDRSFKQKNQQENNGFE